MIKKKFSLSIVSHGHKTHVVRLLGDLARLHRTDFEVILTVNVPEDIGIDFNALPFSITLIHNPAPKGFAENHNAAFSKSDGENFVILNPDIALIDDPFEVFSNILNANPTRICAPTVLNEDGELEDSARSFPTPMILLMRFASRRLKFALPVEPILGKSDLLLPDWVAGMFVVVPHAIYKRLNGLDERYHMYFEDVDFCARARLAGYQIIVSKDAKVIHYAQRDSHRKMRYLLWHLKSAFKFFTSSAYLRIRLNRLLRA